MIIHVAGDAQPRQRVERREGRIRASAQAKQISLGLGAAVIPCHYGKLSFCSAPPLAPPPAIGRAKWSNSCLASPLLDCTVIRGVETLPSFGLVMSSGDFVVLTRLDGSVPLNRRSREQPAEQPSLHPALNPAN